ncbi:MAG: 50S ribosomal protein L10 [Candidatus Latescibacteria bacterium]|nr:50S ribosomal protein L10 [Candidatus Latescibacterota bacterium]
MPTDGKVSAVEELTRLMSRSQGFYLADFTGLDVPDVTRLRKRLRDEDIIYRVVKNRLALIAVRNAGIQGLDEVLQGPTGLASSETDPVAAVRLLHEFASETNGLPRVKGGFADGRVFREDQLESLAQLPPREVLLGQLVASVQSPLTGLVLCLGGLLQSLVLVLNEIAGKKGAAGEEI